MSGPQLAASVRPPVHFKLWCGNSPYDLCDDLRMEPGAINRYTPLRSLVTCPACLERLR